jgi:hypothetical protein
VNRGNKPYAPEAFELRQADWSSGNRDSGAEREEIESRLLTFFMLNPHTIDPLTEKAKPSRGGDAKPTGLIETAGLPKQDENGRSSVS